jgi:hypothetical protein
MLVPFARIHSIKHKQFFVEEFQMKIYVKPVLMFWLTGILMGWSLTYSVVYADVNANTDDRSVAIPTDWWIVDNVSATDVDALVAQKSARLTDVEIHSIENGQPRFNLRMVKNSGAYAAPSWWWYYGMTFSQITTKLLTNHARLLDLEPYDAGGGVVKYATVMVANTDTFLRSSSYLTGVTVSQIQAHITNTGHRMINLNAYQSGANTLYSAVFVANTGADHKDWQWLLNVKAADIDAQLQFFNGRLVDIDRQPDGTFNIVMVKNTGNDALKTWLRLYFTSVTELNDFASQMAVRPIDMESYLNVKGERRYIAVFIDNAYIPTKRIRDMFAEKFVDDNGNPNKGIFAAYLKQVGASFVKIDLNSSRKIESAHALNVLPLLHSLRSVKAGNDNLLSILNYYDYVDGTLIDKKNACPDPSLEIPAKLKTDINLASGLKKMMGISDNRMTRGLVIRYGLDAINSTTNAANMTNTAIHHNIGCAYWNPVTGLYDTSLRNNTTVADLANSYESVFLENSLSGKARERFLKNSFPTSGANSVVQQIIDEEAALQGKQSIAASFGSLVRTWGKSGSYDTCLPSATGECGKKVIIRSSAGVIKIPIKMAGGLNVYRSYVFARTISDVPVSCFSCWTERNYTNHYYKVSYEMYREIIRSALQTWLIRKRLYIMVTK